MKQRLSYLLAAAAAVLFWVALPVSVVKADTAAAQCYSPSTDAAGHTTYAQVDCATSGADNAGSLSADTCYVLGAAGAHADLHLSVIDCQVVKDSNATAGSSSQEDVNKIYMWIQRAIDFTTGVAGVAIVSGIIIGGIQYSTAGANPSGVAAGKKRIIQSLIALLALFFMYTFLQWLIPGGLFQ